MLVTRLIGVTVPEAALATYASFPLGVIAIARGPTPTVMGGPLVAEVRFIGTTFPAGSDMGDPDAGGELGPNPATVTYAVRPSGAIAIELGPSPTWIGGPGTRVTRLIGVTVSEPELAT